MAKQIAAPTPPAMPDRVEGQPLVDAGGRHQAAPGQRQPRPQPRADLLVLHEPRPQGDQDRGLVLQQQRHPHRQPVDRHEVGPLQGGHPDQPVRDDQQPEPPGRRAQRVPAEQQRRDQQHHDRPGHPGGGERQRVHAGAQRDPGHPGVLDEQHRAEHHQDQAEGRVAGAHGRDRKGCQGVSPLSTRLADARGGAARVPPMTAEPTRASTPQLRPAIRDIPAYVPGRPPAPAAGRHDVQAVLEREPLRPAARRRRGRHRGGARMNRYPDMGCTELYAALAARLDVPVTHLAAGTGSVAVLYHLLQAFCEAGDEVVYAWRSFEAYPIAVVGHRRHLGAGAADRRRPARPGRDGGRGHRPHQGGHRLQPEQPHRPVRTARRARGLPGPGAVARRWSCSTRPTASSSATRTPSTASRSTARGPTWWRCAPSPRPTGWPASGSATSWPRSGSRPRCARARCRSGSPRSRRPPRWPRSSGRPTCSTGCEALTAERDRVVAALTGRGWRVPDAQGNFVWLPLGERTADFVAAAEQAGIVVRPFADEGVRVTIGEPAGNDVFLDVAAAFAGEPDRLGRVLAVRRPRCRRRPRSRCPCPPRARRAARRAGTARRPRHRAGRRRPGCSRRSRRAAPGGAPGCDAGRPPRCGRRRPGTRGR